MQRKSRACFASHDEWLAYVRRELSRDEQPTALAYGRMELFLRFLELRGQSLPAELKAKLDLILGLPDPDRADRLDTLNDRIMAHLIEVLFAEAGPTQDEEKHTRPVSYTHLDVYKRQLCSRSIGGSTDFCLPAGRAIPESAVAGYVAVYAFPRPELDRLRQTALRSGAP